ncbi:MAG: methyltransferase domain-containing protein [Woeseiaceae bacterium]|nr:methyltransferase domain-containing protein [Woeseiaceae bacterium]
MPSPLANFLGYLNWLARPSHGLSTSEVYDLIATASPTEHGLYLNLGYWREAETMDDASEALAMLVADAGGMTSGDIVLDCGFGFADQDLLWARERQPQQIIGLNITASQVERARQRVADAGLEDRIDLREGSATGMPVPDASVDLVVSLESAFHYQTREDFFAEAFRVLRPGGRLVTADILPMPRSSRFVTRMRQRLSWYLVASRFNIPEANRYLIQPYEMKLEAAGFDGVGVKSIRDDVYAPLHDFLAANPRLLERQHWLAKLLARATLTRKATNVYAGLDYILAVARKPAR